MGNLMEKAKTINAATLHSIGITFDNDKEESLFVRFVSEELEQRVGARISSLLNPTELKEFDTIADESQAKLWLEEHVPNYNKLTHEEIISFKRMLMRLNRKISTSSKEREPFRSETIESLNLSAISYHCLKRYGITAVGEIIDLLPSEWHQIRNLSSSCIKEIQQKIEDKYNYQIIL